VKALVGMQGWRARGRDARPPNVEGENIRLFTVHEARFIGFKNTIFITKGVGWR
jgi:hypothetical protein